MRMRMMLAAAAVMALTGMARAADVDDVRAAMKHMDSEVADGRWLDALDGYYTVNDSERGMAKAMVEMDAAMNKLETAVRAKFGAGGWESMGAAVHALPKGGYDAADVKVNGAVATVTWTGSESPVFLKKVGGAWKISIPDLMAYSMKAAGASEAQARELEPQVLEISIDRVRRMSSGLVWLSLEVADGKYGSAAEVKTAAADVMANKKK